MSTDLVLPILSSSQPICTKHLLNHIFRAATEKLEKQPKDVLYHYTDGYGLHGILKEQRLRATQISCLNDKSEFVHSIELFRDALDYYSKQEIASSIDLHHSAAGWITRQIFAQARRNTQSEKATLFPRFFVACLTEEGDQLSQWRGYGGKQSSYAVGFDFWKLLESVRKRRLYLRNCVYEFDQQQGFIENILKELPGLLSPDSIESLFHPMLLSRERLGGYGLENLIKRRNPIHTLMQIFQTAFDLYGFVAPLMKHPAFSEEREWRIVRYLDYGQEDYVQYRPRDDLIVPYVSLDLTVPNDDLRELLPICEVVIGPSERQEHSAIIVENMLSQCGYKNTEVRVSRSEIPFRAS